MRIRTIKPEFWKHEDLAGYSRETRLVAISLLNYSDDEGYFNANLRLMRGELFPLDEESFDLAQCLNDLEEIEYIRIYESNPPGRRFGKVVNFNKHQRIDRPSGSKIKDKCNFSETSTNGRKRVDEDSTLERNREQGTEGKDLTAPEVPKTKLSLNPYKSRRGRVLDGNQLKAFLDFWNAFDFKKNKAEAADAWIDLGDLAAEDLERINIAAKAEASERPELRRRNQNYRQAANWLAARPWEDYDTFETYGECSPKSPDGWPPGFKDLIRKKWNDYLCNPESGERVLDSSYSVFRSKYPNVDKEFLMSLAEVNE
ncbi:MAG: hypothetical protein P8L44_09205 [Opitutales bacterium]|nr:hypothetical protein [Opitutales bacterium]